MTDHARCWWRLAGPLLLLLVEVGALTPFVEFTGGPMEWLANARVCSGLVFALVAFLFVLTSREDLVGLPQATSSFGRRAAVSWLAVNLGLYGLFFAYSVLLAGDAGPSFP